MNASPPPPAGKTSPLATPVRAAMKPLGEAGGALRNLLPRRLLIRTIIILVAPMVILQAIITYLFLEEHEARTTGNLTRGVVDQIALVVQLAEGADDLGKRHELAAEASGRFGMAVSFLPGEKLPAREGQTGTQVGEFIGREMDLRIPEPHWYDAQRFGEHVDLRVEVAGGVLRFLIERKRFININMHIFPIWMVVFSLLLLGVAILFLRNQVRPILRLAAAAEAFGRGRDVPDFKPSGALEVRRAAIAFIGMKQRLSRQMQQRTEMLAGVSHDLRTPLTRMKLELAMMDEDETKDLRGDVTEMERMLDGYLAFARGEDGEHSTPTDVGALLREIVDEARRGENGPVALALSGDLGLEVKPGALKRCIVNLVSNALKYGGRADIAARRDGAFLEIVVDDDGPGIPADRRHEAFKPFRRLSPDGRNLDAGGVGLGLAIARDIARGHGGDIRLDDSPSGGLRATLRIPA